MSAKRQQKPKHEYLKPIQVADRLQVSERTVREWLRNGTLKGVRLGEKLWRVSEEEVQRFLKRGR